MRTTLRGLAAALAATFAVVIFTGTALAHEEVGVGALRLVIGFGSEPAYLGQPNSVQVRITHGDDPVTDLRSGDLQAEVSFGDASTTLDLEPNFAVGAYGEPGDYRAWFVPSQAGDYTFRITGTVDGDDVDETVTSGPQTFSDVIDVAEVSFPPVEAPTNEELATRIEQDATRAADALANTESASQAAADDAASAQTTAMIALIVGAIGVIAGVAGIATGRAARR